ncbi:hypothetical protein HN51_070261 [Arachis hypogaea]
MAKQIAFSGILNNMRIFNPDLYNWNRVKVRYCDGSSFTSDKEEVNPVSRLGKTPNACHALVVDLSDGEHGIIALTFGYVGTGNASDIVSEELACIEEEFMDENVVATHSALVAQVEKDINANFEQELLIEGKDQ